MFKASIHTHLRNFIFMAVLFAIALALSASRAQVAHAANQTVTNTDDSGAGSLRQAIADASPGDTITFAPGLNGQTITLTSEPLTIDKDLTISGPGASQLEISGNNARTVFVVLPGVTATIQGVTIRDGNGDAGGGIFNDGATLTVSNSTFSGNSATDTGGGITNGSWVNIKNSIIANSPSGGNCDDSGTFIVAGVNFSDDITCPGFTQVTSAQLNLGALANNGGPTQTIALQSGSVAIDAATDCTDYAGNPVGTDQRGVTRPQGAACDVGAYEARPTYTFSGFFQPVDNPPTFNVVKAGSAIPVKFSLGGYRGLSIFAAGSPSSQQIACDTSSPASDIEVTVTAGGSSLSYDAATDTYTYVWKTNAAWAGTCRQLNVKLNDGTSHLANFRFK
jgi:hypothetical protein